MRVVVAEKPSVARDLARVLAPGAAVGDGCLTGADITFTWALGHLLELAPPEAYDPGLRQWRLESLPIVPSQFHLSPRADGNAAPRKGQRRGDGPAAQLGRIRRLLAQRGVEEVVNACDAGREGERIFREILQVCPTRARLSRLWLSETTAAAVRKAWAERRPLADYDRLAHAADARAEADWIVGLNTTRALTVRHRPSGRGLLTAGRVQTPTLALLTAREEAVRAFRPEPYCRVEAEFALPEGARYPARWLAHGVETPRDWQAADTARREDDEAQPERPGRLATREEAEAVVARIAGRDGVLAQIERRERREAAPLLFNLSDLQRAANRQLGLTARQTLEIAQRLYEAGLLSYPRTDSRHITPDLAQGVARRLAAAGMPTPAIPPARAACVDAARVTDHYGLLPTEKAPGPSVAGRERAVWLLVARRAAAAFQEAALWRESRALSRVGDDWLVSAGHHLLRAGWRAVEPLAGEGRRSARRAPAGPEEREGEGDLPAALLDAAAGTPVHCLSAAAAEHTTRPPARFTDASLLRAMENAGRSLEERELRQAMAGAGLGTAATRAEILESLVRRGYVRREGRALVPTEAGEALVRAAPPSLRSAELTARWEARLAAIEKGADDPARFREAIATFTGEIVQAVRAGPVLAKAPEGAGGAETAGGRGAPRRRTGASAPPRRTARTAASDAHSCPRCGGPIAQTAEAFRCGGTCGLRVARRYAGRATLWSDVEALLRDGHTPLRRGFRGPAGEGAGRLVVGTSGVVRVAFEVAPATPAGAPQPRRAVRRRSPARAKDGDSGPRAGGRRAGRRR